MAEPLEEDEQLEFSAEFSYDGEVWQPSHRAATIIQAHWRGFVGRWAALHKRALYTAAAEVIQVRPPLAPGGCGLGWDGGGAASVRRKSLQSCRPSFSPRHAAGVLASPQGAAARAREA